jgi:hypothetical protein
VLAKHPKAHTPKQLPLFFTSGDLFESLLDGYLRPNIRKGMAPVFRNIRRVYSDPVRDARLLCNGVFELLRARLFCMACLIATRRLGVAGGFPRARLPSSWKATLPGNVVAPRTSHFSKALAL